MLEFLFELLVEAGFQIVGEGLVELGLQPLKEIFEERPNPFVAALGYMMLGGMVGGLSLLVMPNHWLRGPGAQVANLLVTPVFAGVAMSLLGRWRKARGQKVIRLDRFSYGYLFALVSALVRFKFAG